MNDQNKVEEVRGKKKKVLINYKSPEAASELGGGESVIENQSERVYEEGARERERES